MSIKYKLDSAFLKEILGDNFIVEARPLYGNKQEFIMNCGIIMECNKIPEFNSEDNSILRRVKLLNFEKTFEGKRKKYDNIFKTLMIKLIEHIKDIKEGKIEIKELCEIKKFEFVSKVTEDKSKIMEDKKVADYINFQDETGKTALIHAIINEKEKLAEILISKKANIDIKDKKGYNAIYYAIKSENKKLIELVLNGKPNREDNKFGNKSILMMLDDLEDEIIIKICDYYL